MTSESTVPMPEIEALFGEERRLLRDLATCRALGDTTTLADANVINVIREKSGAAEEE